MRAELPVRYAPVMLFVLSACIAHAQHSASINLFFYGAKENLNRKQVARLDSLVNAEDRSKILGITLVGHTDSLFGRASNVALAEKRALSVRKLLAERDIPDSLIAITAFNTPTPVMEDHIPTGRDRNRRVFVRVEYGPADVPVRPPAE